MKIKSEEHNIVYLMAESRYELTFTFWRLQEYYESPEFRNKYFTFEEYADWYAKEYGNFTYFSDWSGFNVPGDVVREFFADVPFELFKKEQHLYELLQKYIEGDEKFYVIGVFREDATMDHEYSHAFYHIFPQYKKEADALVKALPEDFRKQIFDNLKEKGYHSHVFTDECVAYLSTNDMPYTKKMAGDVAVPWENVLEFQQHFQDWKEDKLEEEDE